MNLSKNNCISGQETQKVEFLVKSSKEMMLQKKYLEAIKYLDDGITIVGDLYFSDGMEDDTSQQIILADIERKNGRLEIAANIMLDVLISRLHACECLNKKP